MKYKSLNSFLRTASPVLKNGPVAVILCEDDVKVEATIRHHIKLGFREVLVFARPEIEISLGLLALVHKIEELPIGMATVTRAINALIDAAPGTWFYYGFNSEFLFYPFCENRSVYELLTFHSDERRDAMLTYVVDLYAGNLDGAPNAVAVDDAYLDQSGYYSLGRYGSNGVERERQNDFYGSLRWRYEEHIPWERRRIDRIGLFRAQKGLQLLEDHRFNIEEYNTYSCPWHHNISANIMSFRTAKALKTNSSSTHDIKTFLWHNSVKFRWESEQLMNMGLMEPGQWF